MSVVRLPSRKITEFLIQEGYLAPEAPESMAAINAAEAPRCVIQSSFLLLAIRAGQTHHQAPSTSSAH